MVGLVHMLLCQDGRACRHAADKGQGQLGQTGQGQHELAALCGVQRAQGVTLQADAPRGAADQLDDPFAGQGLEVLFSGVG